MTLRQSNLDRLRGGEFDVLVIGGGINGAVSAAALAAKGARVALVDRGDFAGQTSSQSSNLAWGGIKYLETREFMLVNKLCKSRNRLMRAYPSTVKEIRFLSTIEKGFRFSPLFIYLGSLLYWVMGRFATRAPRWYGVRALDAREEAIDVKEARAGIEYSDCYLYDNDARFVFNFVRKALNYGAAAANYVNCDELTRHGDGWHAQMTDVQSGDTFQLKARAVVNAAGPGADDINASAGIKTDYRHVFSKGIHLVVDRVTRTRRILAFFASDGRLFFVMPMGPKTCIGTTDTRVEDPHTGVTDEDRAFVLSNANEMLNLPRTLTRDDIIAERCGVRPLAVKGRDDSNDWVALSRKHVVEVEKEARFISIFGGKITDCLNVGDEIAETLRSLGIRLPDPQRRWYGEPPKAVHEEFLHQAERMNLEQYRHPMASEPLARRFWRRYGARALEILETIRRDPASAKPLIENAEYLRCEIEQAARDEMITELDDFLRRRSKISLVVPPADVASSDGLREACTILFGQDAEEKLKRYCRSVENPARDAREAAL
ncbi:MAG: glycerol-3-phosphate dehydrogenase/oxidase [Pseudomonadota bacterium]